jgi:hypothetical protein
MLACDTCSGSVHIRLTVNSLKLIHVLVHTPMLPLLSMDVIGFAHVYSGQTDTKKSKQESPEISDSFCSRKVRHHDAI